MINNLSVLSDDPDAAIALLEAACRGDMDAQYAAGLIFVEGRGVDADLVQAYFWLTRAHEQGDPDAAQLRQLVVSRMNGEEFEQARYLLSVSDEGCSSSMANLAGQDSPRVLH